MAEKKSKGHGREASDGSSEPGKAFQAHGVQRPWLEAAHGKGVQVQLLDGTLLSGTVVGYDIYCLAIQQAEREEPTLVFKHAVAYVTRSQT